jgi:hypothetical protein
MIKMYGFHTDLDVMAASLVEGGLVARASCNSIERPNHIKHTEMINHGIDFNYRTYANKISCQRILEIYGNLINPNAN